MRERLYAGPFRPFRSLFINLSLHLPATDERQMSTSL